MGKTTISWAVGLGGMLLGLMVAATTFAQETIDQPRPLPEQLPWSNVWGCPRYAPTVAGIYASPYGRAGRTYRQALRYGYPPLFRVWPPAPVGVYGYPYYGYGYRPAYGPPPVIALPTPLQPQAAVPAAPQPQGPGTPPPSLEPIPAPPGEPGSR